jgi:hypothetical protein
MQSPDSYLSEVPGINQGLLQEKKTPIHPASFFPYFFLFFETSLKHGGVVFFLHVAEE